MAQDAPTSSKSSTCTTSASSAQGGRRYGHILDPRTGYPVNNGCLAVSVVAPTCTVAGILTTSAFILGAQDGYHLINGYHGASGAITTEQTTTITPRFNEHLVQQK